ncbi:hypothetical protein AC578_2390 [Pseudocercospora eumusae]|uniref:Uncharacterized protein n=1 Tax=Pseudocercospora eumusae TaxID=321146 RepID=A0A139HX73_9PEZI|nr:hypothetical protein AC578_2390 [Pseudocercospora eumusae]
MEHDHLSDGGCAGVEGVFRQRWNVSIASKLPIMSGLNAFKTFGKTSAALPPLHKAEASPCPYPRRFSTLPGSHLQRCSHRQRRSPIMETQQYKLRSLNGELRTLAKQAVGRTEDWIAAQLEEFHIKIERKYQQAQQEAMNLNDQVNKLKEENERLVQKQIDSIADQKHSDGHLRHDERIDLAQIHIDRILQQKSAQSMPFRSDAVQAPADPAFHGGYQHHYGVGGSESRVPPRPMPQQEHFYSTNDYYPLYQAAPYPWHYAAQERGYYGYAPHARDDYARDQTPYGHDPRPSVPLHSPTPPPAHYFADRPQKRRRALSRDFVRPIPICRLCWVSKSHCDGLKKCLPCFRREADCNYEECELGESCSDPMCARIHPRQKEAWKPIATVVPTTEKPDDSVAAGITMEPAGASAVKDANLKVKEEALAE